MRIPRAIVIAAAAGLIAGCSESVEVRYRVTATVEDNGRLYSGSGVWSSRQYKPLIPLDYTTGNEFHGDAVAVRIPGKGMFFLIPSGPEEARGNAALLPEQTFRKEFSAVKSDRMKFFRRISSLIGKTELSICDYNVPTSNGYGDWWKRDLGCLMMAFTTDPLNKASLKSVPRAKADAVIGKGVRIRPVRVTITDDEVTRDIFNILPWLKELPDFTQRWSSDDAENYGVPDEGTWMRR